MSPASCLAMYCLVVIVASLAGGWLPAIVEITHRRLQVLVSVVAGLMLGVALYHLLPHAAEHLGSFETAVSWMMIGLLTTFFMLRSFHAHHHGAMQPPHADEQACAGLTVIQPHEHAEETCGHGHVHGQRGVSWMGVAAGLSLHTLIDGFALGAAVFADADEGPLPMFAGLGTFLAVALHKPLDSLSITTLMQSQGWPVRTRQLANLAYAAICPIGAVLFALGAEHSGAKGSLVIGAGLAFAAGAFLCIALSDLLPEVEYHSHDRLLLSAALLTGVALAVFLGRFEPHEHGHTHDDHSHAHEHHSH